MNIEDVVVKKEISVVFMGTPDFAVPVLQGLIDNYNVRAVVTQPDKPVGRNGEVRMTPIKKLALDNTILVLQPHNLKEEWEQIKDLHPDIIITCAYGQIVPRELLVYPKYGCINVHASLLPKLRGGAPIHRAIIEGFKKTGITIMHMNPRLDEGDIISQEEMEITDMDTAATLHDKLSKLGSELLLKTLPSILDGTAPSIPQDNSESTYAYNISPEDEKIDFSKLKRQIYNQVRGLNSWPGAYFMLDGKRIKVWECKMSDNDFSNLLDGQISGLYKEGLGIKPKMSAVSFINGYQDKESLKGKICD